MKIKRTIDVFIKRLEGSSKQSELQEAKEMAISDITEAIQSTQAPQTLNTARAALRYLLQHAFAFCDGMTQWVQYIEADGDEADKEARRDYHRAQAVLDVIERVDRECEIWGICSPLGNLESTDNELCEDVGQPLIVEVSKTTPADDPDRIDLGEYLRNADIEEIATREIDVFFTQLEEYARKLSPEPSTAMERSTTAGTATPSPDDSRADEAETTPPEPSTASASTPMESSEAPEMPLYLFDEGREPDGWNNERAQKLFNLLATKTELVTRTPDRFVWEGTTALLAHTIGRLLGDEVKFDKDFETFEFRKNPFIRFPEKVITNYFKPHKNLKQTRERTTPPEGHKIITKYLDIVDKELNTANEIE